MEKIRLTASDRESLIRLNIAYEILETEGQQLNRRFRAIQGGRRDLGMLKAKNFGMWLSYEVIQALLSGCHDHCMMCPSDKAQRRACKLRKALETIPNDAPDRSDDDCPFYTIM